MSGSSAGPRRTSVWSRRRAAAAAAGVALTVSLPIAAFFVAPSARADDSPGANLAGINASSTSAAIQIAPLTPAVLPVGSAEGNVVEADIPYASSATTTGPSNSSIGSPFYPGDAATGAGNAIATFAPNFPPPLVQALNYPVLARASYPAQVTTKSSSDYAPAGVSGPGVGTASAKAADSGATATAATSQESFGAGSGAITIASSTATTKTELAASTVRASSHTEVGTIKLLGGLIQIAGITSDAAAGSDGALGKPTTDFHLGAVTVAGVAASIGPHGISLDQSGQSAVLITSANQALTALKQAGISMQVVAPNTTVDAASATVSSAALEIEFMDDNIPNPNGLVPLSGVGMDLLLGESQASANATALPAFGGGDFGGTASTGAGSPDTSAVAPTVGGDVPVSPSGGDTGAASSAPLPAMAAAPASAPGSAGPDNPPQAAPPVMSPPQTLLGAPIKVAWVVIAFLLSLVVSGPLLGYANWQLLRGRKS